jgi:A/G-specific adenine glycosylase
VRQKKVQSSKASVQNRNAVEGRSANPDPRFTFHVSRLLKWFTLNARDLPWRRTHDPYAVWVSEIMLQQTQVKTVIPYFDRWMRELSTVESLANASSEKVHKLWEGLGYYTRVRNMQKAAQVVVEKHGGGFPTAFDDVLALPGIGRYTAGAICSIAYDEPAPILDGNVIRVLTRVFGIRENVQQRETNARLWDLAGQLVSAASLANNSSKARACSALNQSLMELGATVCVPRAPRCDVCPVRQQCSARLDNCIEQLPNLGKRPAQTPRRFIAGVIMRNGCVLVRQRPAGVVNAQLWEFPNVELPVRASAAAARRAIERELGCAAESLTRIATLKHSITRYRITLEAVAVALNGKLPGAKSGEWVPLSRAAALPFTSAHGKVLRAVLPAEPIAPL